LGIHQVPEPPRNPVENGVLDLHRTPQTENFLGRVLASDAAPARIVAPLLFERVSFVWRNENSFCMAVFARRWFSGFRSCALRTARPTSDLLIVNVHVTPGSIQQFIGFECEKVLQRVAGDQLVKEPCGFMEMAALEARVAAFLANALQLLLDELPS